MKFCSEVLLLSKQGKTQVSRASIFISTTEKSNTSNLFLCKNHFPISVNDFLHLFIPSFHADLKLNFQALVAIHSST